MENSAPGRLLACFADLLRGRPVRTGGLSIERPLAQLDADIAAKGWQRLENVRHPLALPE